MKASDPLRIGCLRGALFLFLASGPATASSLVSTLEICDQHIILAPGEVELHELGSKISRPIKKLATGTEVCLDPSFAAADWRRLVLVSEPKVAGFVDRSARLSRLDHDVRSRNRNILDLAKNLAARGPGLQWADLTFGTGLPVKYGDKVSFFATWFVSTDNEN